MTQAAPPAGTLFGTGIGDDVEIVPYDPAWRELFEQFGARLRDALGATAVRIDHVGSTAVPGLASKPVIDIQVAVADFGDEAAYRSPLEALGLVLRYREPDWAFFRPPAPPRTHHVHVTPAGSERERLQLLFLAYLRHDHERRDAYGALKLDLADRYRSNRIAYTDAKTAFISETLQLAEAWASATGWHVGARDAR